jgi:hypothetical protein
MFYAPAGGIVMGQNVRFTRSKVLARRGRLQERFFEVQQLKEQIRLAEIAANNQPLAEEDWEAERPRTANQ